MEVKYLCLEHIFFRWPQRPLALALASKNTGLGVGLEHAGLEPIPVKLCKNYSYTLSSKVSYVFWTSDLSH